MKGSQDAALKLKLKELIVVEADKDVAAADIGDDEVLFGPDARLALDSIDGLQISMALQVAFGVRITDPKQLLRIMRSVNTLADHLQPD
ncbi:MAG TPA: phosphopantetheine-binding protein [Verrucomicrobiae bacterium]|nr:phosphopantetheine-binding protein [Verrucomicrobiae bacterium]